MKLIEADLQLIMRICIDVRRNEKEEYYSRLSIYNLVSRKGYSLESLILEKRLMHDMRVCNEESMVYNMSDIEAWCDLQLPKIGGITEESLGIERKPMRIFKKILPVIKCHILTSFGISSSSRGGKSNLHGAGKRNIFWEKVAEIFYM